MSYDKAFFIITSIDNYLIQNYKIVRINFGFLMALQITKNFPSEVLPTTIKKVFILPKYIMNCFTHPIRKEGDTP
jgi:hypothetical protein